MPEQIPPAIQDALKASLEASLRELIDDAQADIAGYAANMSTLMMLAVAEGNPQLIETLKNNIRLLGEIHRVRLVHAEKDIAFALILNGVRLATAIIGAI